MRTDQPRINIRRVALIFVVGIIIASCSEKLAPDREKEKSESSRELVRESEVKTEELQPSEDKIAQDCVAFVRSTKVVPARAASADCPGCPAGGTDVLVFRHMKTDSVSCSGDTCTVLVTIRAVFNPGAGETIAGGLIAWIPPEQRSAYLSGRTPSGEQAYHVQMTYKRRGKHGGPSNSIARLLNDPACLLAAARYEEMSHAYLSVIAATLIALFSMTAVAETSPPGMSGIEGMIVVSPIRPGPIRKDEERSIAPVRNAQFAIKAGDATVKTFTTDGEGRFQVALPPGHYVIVREGAPPQIGRWRFEADVVAGQVTKVNWTADSGMR